MASNREERFQMRQRGAGTHKIKDVSFSLAFPALGDALQPQQSSRSRRTPQPEQQPLRPQRSTRRTPQPAQQPLPLQRSSRRTPAPLTKVKATPDNVRQTDNATNEYTSRATQSSSQGSVSKKQKLTGPTPVVTTPTINDPPSSSTRSRSAVGNASSISRATAASDDRSSVLSNQKRSLRSRSSQESAPSNSQNPDRRSANFDEPQTVARQIVTGPIIQKSKPGSTIASKSKQALKSTVNTTRNPEIARAATRQQPSRGSSRPRPKEVSPVESEHELYEEVADDDNSHTQNTSKGRPGQSLSTVEEEQEDVEAPPEKQRSASTRPLPPRSKTTGHAKPITTRKPSTTGRTKRSPTHSTRARTSDISDASTLARRPSAKDTVPITVHRLSQPQALNNASGRDSTASAPTIIRRSGVNPIDVLAQICKELIAHSAETLQRGNEAASTEMRRGEAARKRKAVEAFGVELEQRLFEMTETLDNNYALSMRLKQANKEKIALREEFLRIRDERQKVALKMDEIRRVHGQEAKTAQVHSFFPALKLKVTNHLSWQDRNDLNTVFYDIELAVERGRAAQQAAIHEESAESKPMSLELLLRSVAGNVSSHSDGGGLLNQVKEFNGVLERVATVLENRA
ncbi:MAG: hypothetical protein M1835_002072 [Candelina submexicana]|nr:MAG: hypothetical protein M1835_002072 [Candelina submexicana]